MSKRAEEEAVEYQIKTHGPNVMGGASMLSEEEYMRFNMNLDFKNGYEQAEKDLGWISVKDRLPEENGWYFTCVEQAGVAQCVGVTYFDSKEWTDDDSTELVDYWMEIPELPNKK